MIEQTREVLEQRFKVAAPELRALIAKRKSSWKLTSILEWDDVVSEIMIRLFQQWPKYDSTRPLDNWANTVITHSIQNLLRKHLYKTARPCIRATSYGSSCVYNTGGDGCKWTRDNPKGSGSGVQDCSCPLYAKWYKKKHTKHAIQNPLSIENHVDEYHSTPDDFLDFDEARRLVEENIGIHLTKEEYRVYILRYVKDLSIKEAADAMGYKKRNKNDKSGYHKVRAISFKIEKVARQIIDENNLIQ